MAEQVDSEAHMHLYTLIRRHGFTTSSETVDLVDAILDAGYVLDRYTPSAHASPSVTSRLHHTLFRKTVVGAAFILLGFGAGVLVGGLLVSPNAPAKHGVTLL